MNTLATAALGNARMRARSGWPLLLLAIAVYSPVGGLPRLALLATGLFFLAQGDTAQTTKTPAQRPAAPRPTPKTTRPSAKPTTKAPRRRNPEGKWTK